MLRRPEVTERAWKLVDSHTLARWLRGNCLRLVLTPGLQADSEQLSALLACLAEAPGRW